MPETRSKGKGQASQPAAPLTSSDLQYGPQRKYQRMQRAKAVMERVLSNTPAFTSLAADKQALARKEIIDLLGENIDDFMHHTPPRTVYPNDQAVLNAINSVFAHNEDVFGIQWNNNLFKTTNAAADADNASDDGDNAGANVGNNGDKKGDKKGKSSK
ncbi:hypothetical protein PG984_011456 [Apiospora sp. TS-2023a]